MVIRFPRLRLAWPSQAARRLPDHARLETARRLSVREVEHRERMLRHLELIEQRR